MVYNLLIGSIHAENWRTTMELTTQNILYVFIINSSFNEFHQFHPPVVLRCNTKVYGEPFVTTHGTYRTLL